MESFLLLIIFSFSKLSFCANFNAFEARFNPNYFQKPKKETPALLKGPSRMARLPTTTASLMTLPKELIDVILDCAHLRTISLIMFTCKSLLKSCIKKRLFQKYLAWNYRIPALAEIPNQFHLFVLEGQNHFKDIIDSKFRVFGFKLEQCVLKHKSNPDQSIFDRVLMAYFESIESKPEAQEFRFANPDQMAAAICMKRA